mgnify:CR=1 FL=1
MSVGIDLGTANILVYVKGKGIVLREPSVVAVDKDKDKILAIGQEARDMIGRTPGNILAIRPLRDGVIADFEMTESMIRYFLEKVIGRSFLFRPKVMICVPTGVNDVEKRAVQEAAEQAVKADSEADALRRFFTGLSMCSASQIKDRIEALLGTLETAEQAASESAKQAKTIRAVGVLIGAGVCILLF